MEDPFTGKALLSNSRDASITKNSLLARENVNIMNHP
jgi:hypothetical protein